MFSHKPGRDRTVRSLVVRQTSGGSGRGGSGRHRSLFYDRLLEGGRKLCVVSFARSPLNNLVIRKFENDSRETYGGFRRASRRKFLRKKKKHRVCFWNQRANGISLERESCLRRRISMRVDDAYLYRSLLYKVEKRLTLSVYTYSCHNNDLSKNMTEGSELRLSSTSYSRYFNYGYEGRNRRVWQMPRSVESEAK